MALNDLRKASQQLAAVESAISERSPLVLQIKEPMAGNGSMVIATVLVDALGLKSGTDVVVEDAPRTFATKITDAIAGVKASADRKNPLFRSVKGDVIVLATAFVDSGKVYSCGIATRVHDGLQGNVQVMTALARPARSTVSKRGAMQFLTITDGSSGRIIRDGKAFTEFGAELDKRSWPGGRAEFIVRDASGSAREFYSQETRAGWETHEQLAARISSSGLFSQKGYAVEVIPAWMLQMGHEQIYRDVNPKAEPGADSGGRFTALYLGKGMRFAGFKPSLIIVADEEEYEFGGKTGKIRRVAAGVHPLSASAMPIQPAVIPTPTNPCRGKAIGIVKLHSDEQVKLIAAERAKRRDDFTGAKTATQPAARLLQTPASGSVGSSVNVVAPASGGLARRFGPRPPSPRI